MKSTPTYEHGKHPNSRGNASKGGRPRRNCNISEEDDEALKQLGKSLGSSKGNRSEGIHRALQLLRLIYHLVETEGDQQIIAWCQEVEPIVQPKQPQKPVVITDGNGEEKAWIV